MWRARCRGRSVSPCLTRRANDCGIDFPAFVDPQLVVETCATVGAGDSGRSFYLRRLTTRGQSLGDLPIQGVPFNHGYSIATLLDLRTRAIFLWDPEGHVVSRVGVDDGSVQTATVPASMLPDTEFSSASVDLGWFGRLVQSPDGTRLYALGLVRRGGPGGRSSGIWVFDSETLALLQHWPARAMLTSLAVSADGTFVYAAGAQGIDADGRASSWPASVTVYDAATGEIQVLYGDVSSNSSVSFPVWP